MAHFLFSYSTLKSFRADIISKIYTTARGIQQWLWISEGCYSKGSSNHYAVLPCGFGCCRNTPAVKIAQLLNMPDSRGN